MRIVRAAIQPLRSATTYTRWVYLLLGGVLLLPFYLAVLVLWSLLSPVSGGGVGAVDTGVTDVSVGGGAVAAAVSACVTLWAPGVATLQLQLTRSLLGGPLAAEPAVPATPSAGRRVRAAAWLALHFLVGFVVALVTMAALTQAALLALMPLVADPLAQPQGPLLLPTELAPTGAWRWAGPPAGAVVVMALVYLVALTGAAAARLAPVFLGPNAADRLAAAHDRVHRLAERNRLAAELHDSIGHALSVVALQAGTAARLIDRDPAFARTALEAIAEQARTAGAELDHMLGVLREERSAVTPQRTLADLPGLVAAARTAGSHIELTQSGTADAVPPAVSRETYRLCQEGVTNALRHGHGDAPIHVELRIEEDRLTLVMTNPTPRRRRGTRRGGGNGLRGMRERVQLLGGELETTDRDGTWRLVATLPWAGR